MEKLQNIKAVLFDFDKTILILPTNYDRIREQLKNLFSKYEISSDLKPLYKSIEHATKTLCSKGLSHHDIIKFKSEAYSILDKEELIAVEKATLISGIKYIINLLKEKDIKIAIVTRNGRRCVEASIKFFNLPEPDLIVSRDDIEYIKPCPEHAYFVLRWFKIQREESIIIGDSNYDIDLGRDANILTILFNHENKSEELKKQASYVIESLYKLEELF